MIPIAFGAAFERVGNFINGEIVGRGTTLRWGMVFEHVDDKIRHPSQLYEAAKDIILFGIIW